MEEMLFEKNCHACRRLVDLGCSSGSAVMFHDAFGGVGE
jgi:hypothetical protein